MEKYWTFLAESSSQMNQERDRQNLNIYNTNKSFPPKKYTN